MIKRVLLVFALTLFVLTVFGITYDDAEFCLKKELWSILDKHTATVRDSAFTISNHSKWLQLYLLYSEQKSDTLSTLECMQKLALEHGDYDKAVNWLSSASLYVVNHPDYPLSKIYNNMLGHFTSEADNLILRTMMEAATDDSLYAAIARLKKYNNYVEELAKALLDMISVERDDSLAFAMTEKFYQSFPYSKWKQAAYYFEISHYIGKRDYQTTIQLMDSKAELSPAHTYLTVLYLLSPTLRRNVGSADSSIVLLEKAYNYLNKIQSQSNPQLVLYDTYNPVHWQARISLQKAKALYYKLIATQGYYGDEDSLIAVIKKPGTDWSAINNLLQSISFENNDTGEQAELSFWKGKLYALLSKKDQLETAAVFFTECQIKGAPRKKYDLDAQAYLTKIKKHLNVKSDLLSWQRKLKNYTGIVLTDIVKTAGFSENRESRIAIGDYDNDSYADILLDGRRLYRNNGNLTFTELTDTLGLSELVSNGGLFADFNLDGKLDIMTISHGEEGNGERLMKNMGYRFAPVNDRAGDIDDKFPTEGAAWVDCFNDSYPDLYCANYEKWEVQSGYEDRFWNNEKGYFTDKTRQFGFLNPIYTHDPGQAGRGVAPADYDNDGTQEILVTNYRLDRNFLWDRQDTLFVDEGALTGLQGVLKKGYYGHSIGADWGDFNNDGKLDVFIANLAHPRYIDISDISMLLRNDGAKQRIIEGDTISYWQFTDITKQAGITYDELHSDPLWFDADNDGFLDLFITSVYENDRSYLYHNNGDGTFTDVTWLAGARVYNGWGNAYADFNHDGKLDLVVGSGNGTKVFENQTQNQNVSAFCKPVWDKGKVKLLTSYAAFSENPNSPAYGTRVILTLKTPKGKIIRQIRELSSAKGTTSQHDQVLYFGIGKNKILSCDTYEPGTKRP
jgi:hypothetical protein